VNFGDYPVENLQSLWTPVENRAETPQPAPRLQHFFALADVLDRSAKKQISPRINTDDTDLTIRMVLWKLF
jgi:hypothetical protein